MDYRKTENPHFENNQSNLTIDKSDLQGIMTIRIGRVTFSIHSTEKHMKIVVDKGTKNTIVTISCPEWLKAIEIARTVAHPIFLDYSHNVISFPEIYTIYGKRGSFADIYSENLKIKEFAKCMFCQTNYTDLGLEKGQISLKLDLISGVHCDNSGKVFNIISDEDDIDKDDMHMSLN